MSVKFRNSDGTTQLGYIDLVNINMTVMNQQNGNLILGTNNGEDMRILTNGNVGIGTQTPHFTLDVNGNARIGTTSTNTFTLFNNRFRYVPWTIIANRTNGVGDDISGNVIVSSATPPVNPRASTEASCNMRYMYSVVGNTLYLNYLYQHAVNTGTVAGTGYYKYRLPAGFTYPTTTLVSAATAAPSISSGTRLGSARMHVTGIISLGSVYWLENPTSQYFMVITRESSNPFAYNSSANYEYTNASLCITFEAAIPLA